MMQGIQRALDRVDSFTRFHHWGPESNPLIARLKRQDQHARLTLRRAIWVGVLLGLLGLIWSMRAVLTLQGDEGIGSVAILLTTFGWVVLVTSPVFSAIAAARYTARALRPETFDLVYIAPLSNEALVRAHVFGTIYHQRRQYALLVALLPLMTITMFYLFLEMDRLVFRYGLYDLQPPSYWDIVGPTLWVLAIKLGLWGFNLLGIAIGVRMGIFRGSVLVSVLVAIVAVTLLLMTPCACFWSLVWVANDEIDFFEDIVAYVLPVLFMLVPWVAAWWLMKHTAMIWRRE